MGKISVIVPVYNVEKYIDKCMRSLISQTYSNLEIILIDDGSADKSGEICDNYVQKDGRIKVIHKKNGGVSSARNIGIQNATGEYITFVDPDDWLEPDMYEQMMSKFSAGVDAVFCGYWENPEEETGLTPILHSPTKQGVVDNEGALYECLTAMGEGYFTAVWNKLFRAEIIKKSEIIFENYAIAEDELWLTKILPKCENVCLLNTPFYHWRQSPDSALRGVGNYSKWYSALQAKSEVVEAVSNYPMIFKLSTAKVYNDIFDIVWRSYIAGDKHISKDFMKRLKPYKREFYKSQFFSKMKKIKFFTIRLFVVLNFPKSLVRKLGTMNRYRMEEKINGS